LINETEQAIKKLDTKLQAPYRILAAKNLKQINTTGNQKNVLAKRQAYVLKNIKNKLTQENAMITKADKGKTIVIIYVHEYNTKVYDFINNNNFQLLRKNPTDKYQKHIANILKQCNQIIDKKQIKYLTQKKPRPPTLKAQIKLHKPGKPIRPVINNINAPAYKLAKHLTKTLNDYLNLSYQYNVQDSATLAQDLKQLTIHDNLRLITLDIKDLYVNIPIHETLRITKTLLSKRNNALITQHIIRLLQTILQQNYFIFMDNFYQPEKSIPMGSPLSNTIAEIFLQHLKHTHTSNTYWTLKPSITTQDTSMTS